MEFQLRRSNSRTQSYYWRIVASNGQVLATSETYVHRRDAINAAESVRRNAGGSNFLDYTGE
jgi:uncharacterized protein YegP (UPF0339 family)